MNARNSTGDRPRVQMTVRGSHTGPRRNLDLIWSLAKRDLQARFKSSVLGWAWSLIVPIFQILIYSLVFSVIFRATPPDFGNGRSGVFAIWLFVGITTWGLISNAIGRGTGAILAARPLLQKIYFPSYVAVFSVVVAIAVQTAIEFGLLLVALGLFGNFGWTWLLSPLLLAVTVLLAAGVAYPFALANVYYRDVAQAIPVLLQLTFFMSAIIYPFNLVPEEGPFGLPLRDIIGLNPFAQLINIARDLLYGLELPNAGGVLYVLAWTVGLLGLTAFLYRKWGQDVSEIT